MATPTGLEPVTSDVTGRRSTLLSYEAIRLSLCVASRYLIETHKGHCDEGLWQERHDLNVHRTVLETAILPIGLRP